MREFRGSVAVSLPRKHTNVVLFQYVRAWQCLAVAGVCHARKLLINKMKSVVVADAWQLYINIYPRGISPRRYIDDSHRVFEQSLGVEKQTGRAGSGEEVGRSTRPAGAVRLYPMPKGEEKVA